MSKVESTPYTLILGKSDPLQGILGKELQATMSPWNTIFSIPFSQTPPQ
jgi:hypothetical protein